MPPIQTENGVLRLWPDFKGPWAIETQVAVIGGRPELVGLTIRPHAEAAIALTSTVLKQLHVPVLLADHLRFERFEAHELAEALKIQLGGPELPDEIEIQILRSYQRPLPRTGRPTHWNPSRLTEVARIYAAAWSARKHPTKAVASRFHLTASGAAKVVKLARARGLLPPTTRGKAGWIESPERKDREDGKGSKEKKR